MATATYLKGPQTTIEYLCPTSAAVVVNQIVVTSANDNASVGVALNAITAGTTGVLDITGCYTFPKATGAVIKAGESVDWDVSAGKVDDNAATSTTGDVANFAIALADAGAGVATVKIMLDPNKAIT